MKVLSLIMIPLTPWTQHILTPSWHYDGLASLAGNNDTFLFWIFVFYAVCGAVLFRTADRMRL